MAKGFCPRLRGTSVVGPFVDTDEPCRLCGVVDHTANTLYAPNGQPIASPPLPTTTSWGTPWISHTAAYAQLLPPDDGSMRRRVTVLETAVSKQHVEIEDLKRERGAVGFLGAVIITMLAWEFWQVLVR